MDLTQIVKNAARILLIVPYALLAPGCGGKGGSSGGAPSIPAPTANVQESRIDGLAYVENQQVPLATGQSHTSNVTFNTLANIDGQLRWTIYDNDGNKDWTLSSPSQSWPTTAVVISPNYPWPLRNGENDTERTLEWTIVHADGRVETLRTARANLVWNNKLYDAVQKAQEGLDLISYRFQGTASGPNPNPGVHVVVGDSATPEETVAGLELQSAAQEWAQQYVQNPIVTMLTANQTNMQGTKFYTFEVGTPSTNADISELLTGVNYTLPTDGGIIKVIETQKGVHVVAAGATPSFARLAARAVTLKLNGQATYDLNGSNTYKVTGTLDNPVVTPN